MLQYHSQILLHHYKNVPLDHMIGYCAGTGCLCCSTNVASHFPNKRFMVSLCTLKTTLTALIHFNLLFCCRTNNKLGTNELIFSIIPNHPVHISRPLPMPPKIVIVSIVIQWHALTQSVFFPCPFINIISCYKQPCSGMHRSRVFSPLSIHKHHAINNTTLKYII